MGIDDLVRVWVQLHKHFEDELPGSGRIFFHTCDTANIHMTYQTDLWRINNKYFLNGNIPNKNVTYQTPVILLALPTALSTLSTAPLCSTHCPSLLCLLPISTLPTVPLYSADCPSLLCLLLLYPLPLSTLPLSALPPAPLYSSSLLDPPLLYLLPLSTLVLYLTPLCSTYCPSLL